MLSTYHPLVEKSLDKEGNCQKIPMTAAYWIKKFERSQRGHTEDMPSDSLPSSTKLGSQKFPENNPNQILIQICRRRETSEMHR